MVNPARAPAPPPLDGSPPLDGGLSSVSRNRLTTYMCVCRWANHAPPQALGTTTSHNGLLEKGEGWGRWGGGPLILKNTYFEFLLRYSSTPLPHDTSFIKLILKCKNFHKVEEIKKILSRVPML